MNHGSVLSRFINEHNIKTFVEVGVWKSRLLREILRHTYTLSEYWAIDQWRVLDKSHGHMSKLSQEDWDGVFEFAYTRMVYFNQLRVLRLTSKKATNLFIEAGYAGRFDLVYLDASHFKKDVLEDITIWFPLVRQGGFIAGHDYGTGKRKGHRVKEAVIEFFGEDSVQLFDGGVWMKEKK